MKNLLNILVIFTSLGCINIANATPEQDKETFQRFYMERFPDVSKEDFGNGVYALDQDARDQWESMSDFPPYEDDLEAGEELFNNPFKNGKNYANCFKNGGENIRQNYPKFDTERNSVITLELAINECRMKNGESALPYQKGDIAKISAYMASTSEGSLIEIKVPNDNALIAYEEGKQYFYSKRGQLNFSCANCHIQNVGRKARSETLSPALGHPTHFPVYRMAWQNFGTLHRRFASCNKQVRAQPLAGQSEDYRNLEYFLTYMSNGLPINGPASRK
ncbi:MAG: sulfur oxidation c-type cytochrome SoxA [Cycloclasticus sp. symbiont of Bathymodiolus heckerae]|nr:MAG: sulfur oxidation c-type cytochrome SoxA [Cycloclasticus sp. symbiont of Bathymodiolus heckerae]